MPYWPAAYFAQTTITVRPTPAYRQDCWNSPSSPSPSKQNALAGRPVPGKASECLVRRRLCRRWARSYAYPGSIPASPEGALSIPQGARGAKISPSFSQLCILHSPLVIERRKSAKLMSCPRHVKISLSCGNKRGIFMSYVTFSLDDGQDS